MPKPVTLYAQIKDKIDGVYRYDLADFDTLDEAVDYVLNHFGSLTPSPSKIAESPHVWALQGFESHLQFMFIRDRNSDFNLTPDKFNDYLKARNPHADEN